MTAAFSQRQRQLKCFLKCFRATAINERNISPKTVVVTDVTNKKKTHNDSSHL